MFRNWPLKSGLLQVQSFLRGWICRRKWKTIIQDYIRSPHAESMRKRNQVVFSMLDSEAEYVQQLHILVNNFLRPLRMAASSKKPPITHDDVSSIFLNRLDPLTCPIKYILKVPCWVFHENEYVATQKSSVWDYSTYWYWVATTNKEMWKQKTRKKPTKWMWTMQILNIVKKSAECKW